MSIKIFGDSFVVDNGVNSWPWHLSNILKTKVSTYGIGGSSLFSAFQLMKANLNSNDTALVKVTTPGRLYFDINDELHFNSTNTANIYLSKPESLSKKTIEQAKASIMYYDVLAKDDFDEWVHLAIIKDIKETFPNAIILNQSQDILMEAQEQELKLLGIDHYYFLDRRVNHISATNSKYVAECISNFYKFGDFGFDINKIEIPKEPQSELFEFLN